MRLISPLFLLTTLLTLSSTANAKDNAEALVKANCASCHFLGVPTPQQIQSFKAPAMEAVLFHVKPAFEGDAKKVKAFIMDYVENPDIKKSVCESNKVAQFGVMPSQKGKVSKEDLSAISDYLIETYPSKKFVDFIKEMKTNGKMNALIKSPFLMNGENLPHLTKILIENWEKGTLNLSDKQKEKLLVVRKETMSGIKAIKKALAPLEAEIVELLVDEESLTDMKSKVDEVAKLKAQATMIHLKCLKESVEILNDEQLELLLPFWGV